eukprot:5506819-Ditylum_brightwellii.AAC.1
MDQSHATSAILDTRCRLLKKWETSPAHITTHQSTAGRSMHAEKFKPKNGQIGQTIHLTSISEDHCPVKFLACRIHHILHHRGLDESPLCAYFEEHNFQHVTPEHLITLLCTAIKYLKLHEAGIDPDLIG